MPEIRKKVFGRTKALERKIDEFLDKVSEGALVFEQAGLHYVEKGRDRTLEEKLDQMVDLESRGDQLRREVETALYTEMLIPDARGDVLSLLDDLDHLLDTMKKHLLRVKLETPQVPVEIKDDVCALVSTVAKAVEATVLASRAYFRDPRSVGDHIHKIGFHESEADRIAIRLSEQIFDSDLQLFEKMHLRQGLLNIDLIADDAEDAGDRLAIYAVKRSL